MSTDASFCSEKGKIMKTVAEQPKTQVYEYDPLTRERNDAITLFAESLDGSMRTPTRYEFDSRELYGEDGGCVREFFKKGLVDAERIGRARPNLQFELRRRHHEYDEYRDMLRLCKGELLTPDGEVANTIVVTSDFPPELMDATEDVGGYKASRKETMLRVITRKEDGLHMYTQTLDGSNRQALEALHQSLGYEPAAGELLGQRMNVLIPDEDQTYLVDTLMGVYDRSLTEQCGGRWRAGRRISDNIPERNTYDFALQQTDLVEVYAKHRLQGTYDTKLQYKLLALLNERFDANIVPQSVTHSLGAVAVGQQEAMLFHQLSQAGNRAQTAGKTFSACGSTMGPDGALNTNEQLNADGYGNKTNESTSYKFDKKIYCRICQAPPKKGEAKKMCGPCKICKTCDIKISKKA